MPGIVLPPFPDDVPTHPLFIVDYELIKSGDELESEKLWKAATQLGFWYLKNHGADDLVDKMFDFGADIMALPQEEKSKFRQGNDGGSFGYKPPGMSAIDEFGTPDSVENLNVAKDDIVSYPKVTHRTYPPAVYAHMDSLLKPFVDHTLEINRAIFATFEKMLNLPPGAFLLRHSDTEPSGSEARVIRSTPRVQPANVVTPSKDPFPTASIGAHTDFGSLSFLHNRLGGLQVLPPGSDSWHYVRPLPGHAICNIGDALTLFSGGILRSNLHRVVPPPGAQTGLERWSLVFFMRPGNNVQLRALVDESDSIKRTIEKMSLEERAMYEPESTAGEWHARRVRNRRLANRKGPETFRASRGMEHKPQIYAS